MMSRDRAFIFIGRMYCNSRIGGNRTKVDPENELLIMATIQYMGSGFPLLQGQRYLPARKPCELECAFLGFHEFPHAWIVNPGEEMGSVLFDVQVLFTQ